MEILINDLQNTKQIDINKLKQRTLNILTDLECCEQCELSIALIDDQEMHRLNLQYRGIDRSTDVLSFALQEAEEPLPVQHDAENEAYPFILGDVILSAETTQRQADEQGHAFEQELYVLLIHGILHLLGYDHRTDEESRVMEERKQKLLHNLDINRNEL